MIDTNEATPKTFDDTATGGADAAPWRELAEHARRELEAWSRSRPRDRHRAERMTSVGSD